MIDQQDDSMSQNEQNAQLYIWIVTQSIILLVALFLCYYWYKERKQFEKKLYDFSDAHPSEVISRQSRDSYRVRNNQTSEITEQLM